MVSINAGKNKRGRPKTTGTGVQIGVRLHPIQLVALDHWIEDQPEPMTRAKAIRFLISKSLLEEKMK